MSFFLLLEAETALIYYAWVVSGQAGYWFVSFYLLDINKR